MLEIDSHFFLRMGEYILENGTLPTHDSMAAWNTISGGPDRTLDYIVTIWTYPLFYYILNPLLGFSLYWVGVWVPAFLGTLHVLIIYFIGKDLFNSRKIGLLSAAFLGFSPGILYRVSAGFMEKEPVVGVFILLSIFFFIKAFKAVNIDKDAPWKHIVTHPFSVIDKIKLGEEMLKSIKTAAYGIVAGIMMAFTAGASGLVSTTMMFIGFFVAFAVLLNKTDKTLVCGYTATVVSYFLFSRFFPTSPDLMNIGTVSVISAWFFMVARYGIEKFKIVEEKYLPLVAPVIFVACVFAVGVTSYVNVGIGEWIGLNIARITNPLTLGVIPSTVAESQHVDDFFRNTTLTNGNEYAVNVFGLPSFFIYLSAIYFAVLGLFLMCYEFVFKKKGIENIFVVVMFALSILFAIGAARLEFVFAFPVAIAAGYFLIHGGSYLFDFLKKYLKGNRQTVLKIAGGIFIGTIIVTHFAAAWVMGNNITSSLTDDWHEAFDWINENTPQDAIILEWWDFGWWFEYVAKRTTLVDGGYHSQTPTQDIAKFYTQPLSDDASPYSSLNFLKNYSVDYVMVSSDLIPKFGALSKIANWGEKVDVLPVFNLINNYQEGGKVLLEYGGPEQSILVAYSVIQSGNETALQNITAIVKMPQGQAYVKSIGIGNQIITSDRPNSIPGMVYFAGNAVIYVPEAVQDCVFVRLYLFDGAGMEKYFEKVYDNKGMKIYKIKYENFPANITGQYINAGDRQ
jgi:dolichyl-diphosphooligosaccharide--protein glycosyltransferase